jgi:hypothetical protein
MEWRSGKSSPTSAGDRLEPSKGEMGEQDRHGVGEDETERGRRQTQGGRCSGGRRGEKSSRDTTARAKSATEEITGNWLNVFSASGTDQCKRSKSSPEAPRQIDAVCTNITKCTFTAISL